VPVIQSRGSAGVCASAPSRAPITANAERSAWSPAGTKMLQVIGVATPGIDSCMFVVVQMASGPAWASPCSTLTSCGSAHGSAGAVAPGAGRRLHTVSGRVCSSTTSRPAAPGTTAHSMSCGPPRPSSTRAPSAASAAISPSVRAGRSRSAAGTSTSRTSPAAGSNRCARAFSRTSRRVTAPEARSTQ
jgi:hypothetical protein